VNRGTLVLLHGTVRGMGHEAEVEVLTRRMQDHNASGILPVFKYVDCTVIGGPADLPDGDYIASFSGLSTVTTRRNGMWLSSGIAVPDENQAFNAGAEAEAEQSSSPRPDTEERKTEPPNLKTATQCNGRRSFLV
jgi:hypothetical protein